MSAAKDRPLLKPLIGECVVPKSESTPTPPINISASSSEQEQENGTQRTPTLNPNPLLSDGMPLPKEIQKQLTDELKYIPLQEIDPYYSNRETFVVIGNQRIYRFSKKHTLLYLSPFNALRRCSIYLLTHWLFSTFIVAVVLCNCFFAIKNPSTNNSLFRISEYIFLPIYGVELTLKILGRGLILQEFTCLRTPWNIFDVFILVSGLLSLFYTSWVFQLIYVLRIFKIIPLLSDLQLRFHFVLEAMRRLRSVAVLGIIIVVLFSTMGIHLFMGILTQYCVSYEDYLSETNVSFINEQNDEENIYALQHNDTLEDLQQKIEDNLPCGNVTGARQCLDGHYCVKGYASNPDYGFTSFDSFPLAALQTIKLTMQDYAQDLYRNIWETGGPWHILFFAAVYLISTFTLKTFVLVIVARTFVVKENQIEESAESNSSSEERSNKFLDIMCKWNCSEAFITVRETMFGKITNNIITELFICVVIIIDIYFMASFRYYLEDDKAFVLYYASKACFLVYTLEFIMKMITQSPWNYFKNYWNIFDFMVIFLYAVNRILTRMEIADDIMRNLLVLRMFKLCSRWPTAELYFVIFIKTAKRYFPIFVFTMLAVYTFGLMGVYIFSTSYVVNGSLAETNWNFTSFVSSSMISFRILSGEWFENFSVCMVLVGKPCIPYFFSSVLLLNFLAALLSVSIVFTAYSVLHQQENDLFTKDDNETLTRIPEFFKSVKIKVLSKLKQRKSSKQYDESAENNQRGTFQEEPTTNTRRSTCSERIDKIRNVIKTVQQHKMTNLISIIVIVISSLALIFYDVHYESRSNSIQVFLYIIEVCFTVYFLIHVIACVISNGIRKVVFSATWLLDLTLVLEMIVNLAVLDIHSHIASGSFLCLRSLRPLMLISRIQRLKVTFTAIMRELHFLLKFIIVILFIWIYFAIQGNHLYAGFLYHCVTNNESDWNIEKNYERNLCLASNMTWESAPHNFNDFSQSFLSVILIVTRNGWLNILNEILNAEKVDEEHPPTEMKYNIFIMAVIVCGTFISFNIFFGAAIYHIKKNMMNFMTSNQIEHYTKKKSGDSPVLIIETSSFIPFKKVHEMVFTSIFDGLVMAVIIVDIVALAATSINASTRFSTLLSLVFSSITFFYTVEIILKLMAWRHHFFKHAMNILDLVIVIVSILGHVFSDGFVSQGIFMAAPVLRALRLLRILQFKPFLRRAPTISTFLLGSCRICPVLANLIYVLGLFFFTFTLLGMSKFQYIFVHHEEMENYYFETFTQSILTIFQMTTFSGWDAILDYNYEDNVNYQNLTKVLSFLFSYIFIVFIIVMNMHCIFVVEVLKCLDMDKEATSNVANPNSLQQSTSTIHETINLNPSRSVSARRKSVACFVMENENDSTRNAQVIILPSDTVQVVFKST